jgi:hypothetical protein
LVRHLVPGTISTKAQIANPGFQENLTNASGKVEDIKISYASVNENSCNSSDECHHGRHKEILRLVRQIKALDHEAVLATANRILFGKPKHVSEMCSEATSSTPDTSSDGQTLEDSKMTRRERKKLRKSGNNSIKDKTSVEVFPQEELDFISEAIHLTVHESKGAWEGMYNYDHKQPEQGEETGDEEMQDEADVEGVTSSVSDFAVRSPADMTPRQRKTQKKFNSAINHSSFSGGSRKFGSTKADPFDGLDPDIFSRLGIEIANPADHSKERRDLATKLVEAVKDDIDTIKREGEDTVMRETGFWRWAGRATYNHIRETRINFDWATGQKKTPLKAGKPEDDTECNGGEIDDRPLPPILDPEPLRETTPKPTKKAVFEEDGFTPVVSKKPAPVVKKERTSISIQTKGYKKSLSRPAPLSAPLFPTSFEDRQAAQEEGAEDFREMIRRQQQKETGTGTLGRWNEPTSAFKLTGWGKK